MKLTQEQIEEIRKRVEAANGSMFRNHAMLSESYVEDIPALLDHIAELERINETFSKQIESVNKDRHLWRELRLEASGRLMEVVPRMTKYEEALQKIFEGEVDSLGDAFLIAKEALKDA